MDLEIYVKVEYDYENMVGVGILWGKIDGYYKVHKKVEIGENLGQIYRLMYFEADYTTRALTPSFSELSQDDPIKILLIQPDSNFVKCIKQLGKFSVPASKLDYIPDDLKRETDKIDEEVKWKMSLFGIKEKMRQVNTPFPEKLLDTNYDSMYSPTLSAKRYVEFLHKKCKILESYTLEKCFGGVYCIANKVNGKIYIGSSNHINQRVDLHFLELEYGLHGNYRIQADYNTMGKDVFQVEVLEEVDYKKVQDREHRLLLEQFYIDKHKPEYNIKKDTGYSTEYKKPGYNKFKHRQKSFNKPKNTKSTKK